MIRRPARALVLVFGLLVVAIVVLVGSGFARTFETPSSSMEPTLHCARPNVGCLASHDDRVIVVKYVFASPSAGDLVAFHTPDRARDICGTGGIFIKRIAAGPGDTWEERNGFSYVNGRRQPDSFVPADERDDRTIGPVRVPSGHYFVLGDNRVSSCDSRSWGLVSRSAIIGRVLATYWPPRRISVR